VSTFTDVTVAALKIAPVGDLELKIPERRVGEEFKTIFL